MDLTLLLPDELAIHIASFLNNHMDIASLGRTNSRWRRVVLDELVFKQYIFRQWPTKAPHSPQDFNEESWRMLYARFRKMERWQFLRMRNILSQECVSDIWEIAELPTDLPRPIYVVGQNTTAGIGYLDLNEFETTKTCTFHTIPESPACFTVHVHNNYLFSGGDSGHVYVWKIEQSRNSKGKPVYKFRPENVQMEHARNLYCIRATDRILLTAGAHIKVWDFETWGIIANITSPSSAQAAAIDEHDNLIILAGDPGTISLLDLRTLDTAASTIPSKYYHNASIWNICYDHTMHHLATASYDKRCQIFDLRAAGRGPLKVFTDKRLLRSVLYDASQHRLVLGNDTSEVCMWDIDREQKIHSVTVTNGSLVRALKFYALDRLVTCSYKLLEVWELVDEDELNEKARASS